MGVPLAEALLLPLRGLSTVNEWVLRVASTIAWISLAIMVVIVLVQVVFRYAFNAALPWPDEAARFCMLWMTGLIAPLAYRTGNFVAIDTLHAGLPKAAAHVLSLVLLTLSAIVLWFGIFYGWKHTFGFGGNFNSSSLYVPLGWFGGETIQVKLRYMYGSLLTGLVLMMSVNIELILRELVGLVAPAAKQPKVQGLNAPVDVQ